MPEEKEDIVKFLENAEIGKEYKTTTWFRCMHIQEFVEQVEKSHEIVGVIFSDNNLGFIIDEKEKTKDISDGGSARRVESNPASTIPGKF